MGAAALVFASVGKTIKFAAALFLLPLCWAWTEVLGRVIVCSGEAELVWVPMLAGGLCWLAIYFLLPRPMWVYVFGHELTHALWAWGFGARVKRFRVSAKGGYVVVSKTNFLIELAPYFFPIYAVMAGVIFHVLGRFFSMGSLGVWFHLCLGTAMSFHFTLTAQVLGHRQTDVTRHGWLFSGMIIWLGNAAVLLFGVSVLAGKVDFLTALDLCWAETVDLYAWMGRVTLGLWSGGAGGGIRS